MRDKRHYRSRYDTEFTAFKWLVIGSIVAVALYAVWELVR